MRDPRFYLLAGACSAAVAVLLSALLTPLMRRLAVRAGAAHPPRDRDVHQEPIPRWGGIAIFAAFAVTLAIAVAVVHFGLERPIGRKTLSAGAALVAGGLILTIVGAIDDRRELSAGRQLLVQVLCALLAAWFGVRIDFVTNPLGGGMIPLPWWVSYPVTMIWIVGVANAVNWIDGIDGLAAGVSAIGACTLGVMAAWSNQPVLTILAAALSGSLLGFLPYNFNPARIFMGGGAQVVGFLLASISAVGAFKVPVAAVVAVPLLVLGLPLVDTTLVILRRLQAGRPIYKADKSHMHHRLLAQGFTQRQTVMILYGISILLCLAALGWFWFFTERR